ncbi:MAG: hypothetical protein U0Q21_06860 [Dermatophilaceae bacterium]
MTDHPARDDHGIAIGGGLTTSDRPLIDETLHQLQRRLQRLQLPIETELSVRDRDRRGMKTTLEIWSPGLPRVVATSDQPDLRDALNEIGQRALSAVDTTLRRRLPMRDRIRAFARTHDRRQDTQEAGA